MRIILSMVLMTVLNSVTARNYYFSNLSGNDNRTASQAQSPSTPWKSINKLNTFFIFLQPGDSVLFKRGETFYGTVIISKSGTVSHPIVIGAYGAGNKPGITALQAISDWSSSGNGKYVSHNPALGEVINIVTLNGVEQQMGRYPNSNAGNGGYLNFESHGSNSITDKQLSSSTNWKGAELVIRTNRFVLDRTQVVNHSGNKLYYSPALSYVPSDGFGYFFQNDIRTLDQLGEWCYNAAAQKINMYFGTRPASAYNVKASTLRAVVYLYNKDNIVFDNLEISGGNYFNFYVYSANNVVIKNCKISFAGVDAINVSNTNNLKIENNIIESTNNIAVNLGNCYNSLIKNNRVKNTGLIRGLGQNSTNKTVAIRETGRNNRIEYNDIDSTGSTAIRFEGNYCLIKNNLINHFNLTKDDGGGIYTSSLNGVAHDGMKVIGNIVLNGSGAAAGTTYRIAASTTGIYMDDYAANVEVSGNTVAYCSRSGAFVHNAREITLNRNTFYNSPTQLVLTHDVAAKNSPLRKNVVKNNILFSKKPSQFAFAINSIADDLSLAGSMDSNYYCRPLDDNFVIKSSYINSKGLRITQDFELKSWQAMYKKDMSSKKTSIQILPFRVKNVVGSNKFSNGAFNSNIRGASVYSTASKYTTSWVSNKLDKGALQGTVLSRTPCVYAVSLPIGALKAGKNYMVTFSVQNSKDIAVNVFFRQSASPYNILSNSGIKNVLKIGPDRKDYELSFSPEVSERNSILVFETNSQQHNIWLDNIKVFEADVAVTNPDDSIRFEYNASQSNKNVPLAGTYVDVSGKVYKDNIVLEPYKSAILIKKGGAEPSAPTVKITSPSVDSKYTAPATIKLTAAASDAGGTITKVAFYNGSALLATETTSPYAWSWNNVPPGKYTLVAKATNNSGKVTTSEPVPIVITASKYPLVKITAPAVNSKYTSPATVNLAASASDADGTIKKVEFYRGSDLLHTEFESPYAFSWKNVPAGNYTIIAKATDDDGNTTTSAGVPFSVGKSKYPNVKITTPGVNSKYTSPATINLTAVATDGDGKIKKVQFYNGTDLLHTEFILPYTFSWKNVPAGNYIITAKAVDDDGNITTSSDVPLSVVRSAYPTVQITSPGANSKYAAHSTVKLAASASDADGIKKVEFYKGTDLLHTEFVSPYTYSWKNVPAGNYLLTAKAVNNHGKITVSKVVAISVVSSALSMAPPENSISPAITDDSSFEPAVSERPAIADNPVKALDFKLLPNPAVNKIQIYFDDRQSDQTANISIIDLLGKIVKNIPVVFSGQKIEVDISSLNPGIYILRFSGSNSVVNKKFVKAN